MGFLAPNKVRSRFATVAIVITTAFIVVVPSTVAVHQPPLERRSFATSVGPNGRAPQGFDSPHNTWAWSMAWFKDKLYVGTNRDWRCVEAQTWHRGTDGLFPYPPVDPDMSIPCPPDFDDLPLQAEIWRWTPPPVDSWERVYQSPKDVPNPEHPADPTKNVPRDIGYRGMAVFKEPDETEALYVGGMSAKPLFGLTVGANMPHQRLLRTTDGVTWTAVPQDPGTTLAEVDGSCFRGMQSFKGKFYVLACNIQGSGFLYESADPKLGNNSFRRVTPVGAGQLDVFEYAAFGDHLYVGLHDPFDGYSVLKTDATGEPPYTFQQVIPPGAFVTDRPNTDVISMYAFRGRLYVGGNGVVRTTAAELIRINPDDTWDVVAGKARDTDRGRKTPISGLDGGFGNHFNQHIWRMVAHDGRMYLGTFDSSIAWKNYAPAAPLIQHLNGYDLWRTREGWYISPLTQDGFGDDFSIGARTIETTPHGLFVGTANSHHGLRVERATPTAGIAAPERLEVEPGGGGNVVSWLPVQGATRYHVLRARLRNVTISSFPFPPPASVQRASRPSAVARNRVEREAIPLEGYAGPQAAVGNPLCDLLGFCGPIPVTIPETFAPTPVASTTSTFAVDTATSLSAPYVGFHYVVVAEDSGGAFSAASNVAQAPSATPPLTLTLLDAYVAGRTAVPQELRAFIDTTRSKLQANDLDGAIADTQAFRQQHLNGQLVDLLLTEDLEVLTLKLLRRLYLAKGNLISASSIL
jgi:hypothetical protein